MGSNQSLEITLLTGSKRVGKTTWLQQHKAASAGFLSPLVQDKRHFLLIPEGVSMPMEENDGALKVGKYNFSKAAFARVEEHVQQNFQVKELIFDEIGPLEIRGEGFADLLKLTLEKYQGKLWIVLRSEIVREAIDTFQLDRFPIVMLDFDDLKKPGASELP